MSLSFSTILAKLVDHAAKSGLFTTVNTHEPKSAPTSLTLSIWLDKVEPIRTSGLSNTSGRLLFKCRVYSNMLQEPQDMIDTDLIDAVSFLMGEYSGDFNLGNNVRNIDLLGANGVSLSAQAGYLNMDSRIYRIMDITVPVIVNDIWEQVP